MEPHVLATDIGGTNTRVAIVNSQGRLTNRFAIPTEGHTGRDSVVHRLVSVIEKTLASTKRSQIIGVGVAVAGPTDLYTGVMHNPPHLPGWDGFTLKPVLEDRLSLKVSVANDATLAALAEHRFGAGKGYDDLVYVTVSTGIGGGFIINGRPHSGSRGYSGEIGHMVIAPDGPACDCGGRGCLESVSSGTAVARDAKDRLSSGENSIMLQAVGGSISNITSVIVANAARTGDHTASSVMEKASAYLGIGLSNLVVALDPDLIIIGGGMSESLDLMMPALTRELDRNCTRWLGSPTPIVKSSLGDNAAILGAAALAFSDWGDGA